MIVEQPQNTTICEFSLLYQIHKKAMKNIVVVGGTKGIGKKIADLLEDSNLFIIARTKSEVTHSENIHFIEADVTQPVINLPMLPEVIDGLVYCPGSINLKPFTRLTEQEFLSDW